MESEQVKSFSKNVPICENENGKNQDVKEVKANKEQISTTNPQTH